MCLFSVTGRLKAEKDIPCVKALGYVNGCFVTPIEYRRVPYLVLSGRRLFRARGKRDVKRNQLWEVVSGGYIHVYRREDNVQSSFKSGCLLFDCIIPKGTEYYESNDGTMYAARKIRFVRKE